MLNVGRNQVDLVIRKLLHPGARSHVIKCPSSTPLLDSYPQDLVPPTGDASGGAEEGSRGERRDIRWKGLTACEVLMGAWCLGTGDFLL